MANNNIFLEGLEQLEFSMGFLLGHTLIIYEEEKNIYEEDALVRYDVNNNNKEIFIGQTNRL